MIFYYLLSLGLNIINIPYDRGANIRGSRKAYTALRNKLDFLDIESTYIVNDKNDIDKIFSVGSNQTYNCVKNKKFPLIIGGDHSISISSIFGINRYYKDIDKKLGVLWCDAHADFNTIHTSPSGNIHGMPVSILCGHSNPVFSYNSYLDPQQFAYFGLRDIDSLEFNRLQDYNMQVLYNVNEFREWSENYDVIHLSFDFDCLDPQIVSCVNTPVENGVGLIELKNLFKNLRETKKLVSMDFVEYNPEKGDDSEVVVELLKTLFF